MLSLSAASGGEFDTTDLVHASFSFDGAAPSPTNGFSIWFDDQTPGGVTNADIFSNGNWDAVGGDSPGDTQVLSSFATFTDVVDTNGASSADLIITFDLNDGGASLALDNISITTVAAVPEPTSLALFGLLGLGVATRRRR